MVLKKNLNLTCTVPENINPALSKINPLKKHNTVIILDKVPKYWCFMWVECRLGIMLECFLEFKVKKRKLC